MLRTSAQHKPRSQDIGGAFCASDGSNRAQQALPISQDSVLFEGGVVGYLPSQFKSNH